MVIAARSCGDRSSRCGLIKTCCFSRAEIALMPLKRYANTAVQAFLTDGGLFQPADSLMTDAAKGLSAISEQPMLIGDELAKKWLI